MALECLWSSVTQTSPPFENSITFAFWFHGSPLFPLCVLKFSRIELRLEISTELGTLEGEINMWIWMEALTQNCQPQVIYFMTPRKKLNQTCQSLGRAHISISGWWVTKRCPFRHGGLKLEGNLRAHSSPREKTVVVYKLICRHVDGKAP